MLEGIFFNFYIFSWLHNAYESWGNVGKYFPCAVETIFSCCDYLRIDKLRAEMFYVAWEMKWKLTAIGQYFLFRKVKILCQRLFLEYFKLFEFNWLDFGGSQMRANIFALRIKFPKKLNATEIESWCFYRVFFNVHTLVVNCWLKLLMSRFIHDFFRLSPSIA